MDGTKLPSRNTAKALDLQAMAGVDKYLANVTSVTIAGESFTPTELKAALQGEIDALTAVESARATLKQLLVAATASRVKTRDLRSGLRTYLLSAFGPQAIGLLHDFGMAPKKRSTPSAATKAEAVVRAKATREARHTMGPKRKLEITGDEPAPAKPTP